MLVKIKTDIILEVKDEEEAEEACLALGILDSVLRENSFPHGEVVSADVDHFEKISDEEAQEKGWVE